MASVEQDYRRKCREKMLLAMTPDDIAVVVRAQMDAARGGNLRAARLCLEYALGKPTQEITITGPMKLYELTAEEERAV